MMKEHVCSMLVSIAVVVASTAQAQDAATRLTLDQSIELALSGSYQARSLLLEKQRAEQSKLAAAGRFKTNAELAIDSPSFAESFSAVEVPNEPVQYNATGTTDWNGRITVRQPLPTNGALSLTSSLQQVNTSTFIDETDERIRDNRFFTSLRLGLNQPLFVPNTLKLNLEQAELELERAEMQYTRTQLDVVFNVTSAFYAFHRAKRSFEIATEEVAQSDRSFQLASTKFGAGLIPEVEALQSEVDMAESRNDLLARQGALARAEEAFKIAVGLPLTEPVAVDADLNVQLIVVDDELALQHALKNRAEIRESEINYRLAEINVKETDARSTIRADLSAFYDIAGVSDPGLDYGTSSYDLFDSSLEDLRDRPNNRGVTLSLTVPMWDSGVNGAEVAAARLTLEQRSMDQEENRRRVVQAVNDAITSLREAESRLQVLERSEQLAERSYQISLARFENGEITTQDLTLDRNRLTQARESYLGAFVQYQLATAELQRQTLYDFRRGQSLVN